MITPTSHEQEQFFNIFSSIFIFLHQVGYAYVMYYQKVQSRMYFENIKFRNVERKIVINDAMGKTVLSGQLALAMGQSKSYKCRDKVDKNTECWEWTGTTKLFVSLDEKLNGDSSDNSPTARCYNFRWESLEEGYTPIDCFNIGGDYGQWYGGGITKDTDWILNAGSLPFSPFVTGDER
jgi:myogenesis-regulating glycosidase